MSSWFDDLQAKRRRFVEAAQENRFEAGIWRATVDKYPDPAHYIFELLQNAEDQDATKVRFQVGDGRLTFEHNGNPFSRADVDNITGIGNTVKDEDDNKIGRYGIGFKSVFAATTRPEIYGTLEGKPLSFAISDLVVPERISSANDFSKELTRFVLDFDQGDPKRSEKIVSTRLEQIGPEVLLFLSHISRVDWRTKGSSGTYTCDRADDGIVTLRSEKKGGNAQPAKKRFFTFSKAVSAVEADRPLGVTVAFSMNDGGQIVPEEESTRLLVFFETEEQTGLLFRLHGPFLLTDNRANIKHDDPENQKLVDEIDNLIRSSLHTIRDRGILTREFLEVLPNNDDNLAEPWSQIREAIIDEMMNEPLIPTQTKGHADASNLVRAPNQIKEAISDGSDGLLAKLTDEVCLYWAVGVLRNTRQDRMLDSLGIEQWSWEELLESLTNKLAPEMEWNHIDGTYYEDLNEEWRAWLSERSDLWLADLYILIAKALGEEPEYETEAKELMVVRTSSGSHEKGNETFFPPDKDRSGGDEFNFVSDGILEGKDAKHRGRIREGLAAMGVREIGEEQSLGLLLKKNYADGCNAPEDKVHLRHMRQFMEWHQRNPGSPLLDHCHIFRIEGSSQLMVGNSCYVDSPIADTGLSAMFHHCDLGEPREKLWDGYKSLKSSQFPDFASQLGVMASLEIDGCRVSDHPSQHELKWDYLYNNARVTHTGINEDYRIAQLDSLLEARNIDVSRLVWDVMRSAPKRTLTARYQPNQEWLIRKEQSSLILSLQKAPWVANKGGELLYPAEVTPEELHPSFVPEDKTGWLKAIGLGENERAQSAEQQARQNAASELGVPLDLVDKLSNLPEERRMEAIEAIYMQIDAFALTLEPEPFPERKSKNPNRRRDRLKERARMAPKRKHETKDRTVRMTDQASREEAKTYLRSMYTNQEDVLICQSCKLGMPFKLPGGDYYFEAVECVGELPREHPENFLALCPICSAKHRFARKESNKAIRNRVLLTKSLEVSLTLAGQASTIRFVEDHLEDLRTVLKLKDN